MAFNLSLLLHGRYGGPPAGRAQAFWKLKPPVTPSTSITSPAKYSPGTACSAWSAVVLQADAAAGDELFLERGLAANVIFVALTVRGVARSACWQFPIAVRAAVAR